MTRTKIAPRHYAILGPNDKLIAVGLSTMKAAAAVLAYDNHETRIHLNLVRQEYELHRRKLGQAAWSNTGFISYERSGSKARWDIYAQVVQRAHVFGATMMLAHEYREYKAH